MILDNGAELERCVLVDWLRQYADKTVLEFDAFTEEQKKRQAAQKHEILQSQVGLNAHVEHTAQTGIGRSKKQGHWRFWQKAATRYER